MLVLDPLRRCVYDQIDLVAEDQVHQVRRLHLDLVDLARFYPG